MTNNILLDVWKLTRWKILQTVLTIITILYLPTKSLLTIWLTVCTYAYLFHLFSGKPKISRWLQIGLGSFIVFYGIAAIYYFFGLWGTIGTITAAVLIMIAYAVYVIASNWKIYNSVTTWGAERIRGKHKKEYNLEEVLDETRRDD